ncbi:MAG: hypothetical protein WAU91_18310, partial [Desulfatitalea sp.]
MKSCHSAKFTAQIAVCLILLLLSFGPGAMADTTVSGTIAVDTTWTMAGSPYIVNSSIRVQGIDGADAITTLTIEPGVEIRFNANTYLYIGAGSGNPGALVAQGTSAAPIRFTANTTNPAPGFWRGVQFQDTTHDATTRMEHCNVEYAGSVTYGTYAVNIGDSAPILVSCQFANSGNYDLYYSGTVGGAVANCTFSSGLNFAGTGQVAFDGNTVNWSNTYPVRLPADNVGAFVASTTFTGLDAGSALQVTGSYLTKDSTWKASVPFAIATSLRLQGIDGADGITTLTIEPGAEIRFNANTYLYIGYSSGDQGALVA